MLLFFGHSTGWQRLARYASALSSTWVAATGATQAEGAPARLRCEYLPKLLGYPADHAHYAALAQKKQGRHQRQVPEPQH